ncbi:hypothetical protein E2986_02003 [Frieseomelitta varia]|uniref:Piwi n=1 Tax=Frieseomelitta varia TaxID=561572 RepID=A0A833W0K8_9HYME|nr:hypothetical protein E2986_02003 [Frieseomelitta varia]
MTLFSAGRATQRGLDAKKEDVPGYSQGSSESAQGGEAGTQLGRGAMRGKRAIVREIVTRPPTLQNKRGTSGESAVMQANYFALLSTPDWCLYQYRVDFAPDEERTAVRKGLLKPHRGQLDSFVFDGTILYSRTRMADMEFWSQRQSDNTNVRITIRLVGDMKRGDPHYIQFFNTIMRKCLVALKLELVGRDYFDEQNKMEVPHYRLELWPGYLTSIRQHESNILMCSEVIHKVMRQQTLLDILRGCYNKYKDQYQPYFTERVVGLVVLTDYNNHTYRITDVDYDATPSSTFTLKTGDTVSYRDYYKEKYQIEIRNGHQPMLVTKSKTRDRNAMQAQMVYLVPELCRVTGIDQEMRENFTLMRDLADYTRVNPEARIRRLITFNERLRSEPEISKELSDWNLKLDNKLVTVPARILPSEKIYLAGKRPVSTGNFADWTKELHNKPLFIVTQLKQWTLISPLHSKRYLKEFLQYLSQSALGMGCRIDKPYVVYVDDDRTGTYSSALEHELSTTCPELMFCVVPNNRTERYSAIKKKCILDRPIPSQVLLHKTLTNRNLRTIATKVAIQINCKLGGAPWSIDLVSKNMMVIGFDVCHDPVDKSNDFGAMVASLNENLSRFFTVVNPHTGGEELSTSFAKNVENALIAYRERNKVLPSYIVIYRDGVGEGQIPLVYEQELSRIQVKLNTIYGEASLAVKMAFVIVTKRINTRIFYRNANPPPGTVVDDVITNPLKYDFFIVSQSVRRGTVSPCSYNVIADSTEWRPDHMQRLTYKLCHMYYNWSGTVRVPAPCQYAHKLAYLVAQYLRCSPERKMRDVLYFL